jgi:hypothetical protein
MNSHEEADIMEAARVYGKRAAIINGILCLPGIAVTFYVYLMSPHPSAIQHPTRTPWSESIESYIFIPVLMQLVVFLWLAWVTLFWKKVTRRAMERETWLRANVAWLPMYHSKGLSKIVAIGFIGVGVFFLGMAIYHSLLVAMRVV